MTIRQAPIQSKRPHHLPFSGRERRVFARPSVFCMCAVAAFLAAIAAPSGSRRAIAAESPANWRPGLSDREMAISRWFSQLSFMQDRARAAWPQWHDDGQQLGITSLRYQLAFAGYGCAAMAAKTPAYRELVERQLGDLCERMIDPRVWQYVTRYWKYGDGPTDPCLYENVMYTGHLTQLMCLYELMTGDTRYSDAGWDFARPGGRRVHYTLRKAIERLHGQSVKSPSGGICCEPSLVFATCNSHSAASMVLFDLLHQTEYARANDKWFAWMSREFRLKNPASREFFCLMYHQGKQKFISMGDVGADCWTLGWGYPWFPSTALADDGWKHLLDKAQWQKPDAETLYAQNNLLVGCCGGGSLAVSNSFIPLLAVQIEGREGPTARKVLRWLETKCGREVDLDGDGHRESYYYHTDPALRIAATGNIAAALATDRDSLRKLYRTPRRTLLAEPAVSHVDYPDVYVRAAEYRAPVLRFAVLKGMPGFRGKTEIVCSKIRGKATVVCDEKPFGDFSQEGETLVIRTDVEREHVFQVRIGGSQGSPP